jgi:hypothetical protein
MLRFTLDTTTVISSSLPPGCFLPAFLAPYANGLSYLVSCDNKRALFARHVAASYGSTSLVGKHLIISGSNTLSKRPSLPMTIKSPC